MLVKGATGIKLCHSPSGLLPGLSLVVRDKRLYVLSMKTNFANLQIAYMLSYSFTCQNYQPVKQENSNPPIWLATMLLRKNNFSPVKWYIWCVKQLLTSESFWYVKHFSYIKQLLMCLTTVNVSNSFWYVKATFDLSNKTTNPCPVNTVPVLCGVCCNVIPDRLINIKIQTILPWQLLGGSTLHTSLTSLQQ